MHIICILYFLKTAMHLGLTKLFILHLYIKQSV